MQSFTAKFRRIFLPFLFITICFVLLYSFLNWLLFIKLNILPVKEDVINLWLPFALAWIPVLIWLRPRINLLTLKSAKGNYVFLYQFAAALAIAAPTIVAQFYITTAAGKLTALTNISQVSQQAPTKYYTLKNYYIDKQNLSAHAAFDVSGKNNEYLNMHLYIALPVLDKEADTSGNNCFAWLGLDYTKQISNRLESKEKDTEYTVFANESQKIFDSTDLNKFVYLKKVGNTDAGDGMKEAVKKNQKYQSGQAPIFTSVDEPFEQRNGNKFGWIFGALAIGAVVWLIMLLFPKLSEATPPEEQADTSVVNEPNEFISLIKPREGYFITPILMHLNILIFLLMVFAGLGFASFKSIDLLNWGGNFKPSTTNGEWWRLLTCIFLHGGIMHLLANMYGLLFVGVFLEPLLGKTKYLIIYLVTGILASCNSLWWHDATVSIGASGAIFGLYGLFIAFLLTKIFPPEFGKAFLTSTLIFVGYNLLMGMTGGIDNAAHIGGLASGFIIGLILSPGLKKKAENEPDLPV